MEWVRKSVLHGRPWETRRLLKLWQTGRNIWRPRRDHPRPHRDPSPFQSTCPVDSPGARRFPGPRATGRKERQTGSCPPPAVRQVCPNGGTACACQTGVPNGVRPAFLRLKWKTILRQVCQTGHGLRSSSLNGGTVQRPRTSNGTLPAWTLGLKREPRPFRTHLGVHIPKRGDFHHQDGRAKRGATRVHRP